jgi:tryptophan synthase beta chain
MATHYARPDKRGYYGPFGGRFVPETLLAPLEEVGKGFEGNSPADRNRSE